MWTFAINISLLIVFFALTVVAIRLYIKKRKNAETKKPKDELHGGQGYDGR